MSSIHEEFQAAARRQQQRPAIIYQNGDHWADLTYGQLADRSARLAGALVKQGVRPGDSIGVLPDRHPDTIAALLAILAVGARYVPLDLSYPVARQRHIVETAGIDYLIGATAAIEPDGLACRFFSVDALIGSEAGDDAGASPVSTAESDAYVMFTSGSTGQPKGVVVPHRAVLRLVCDADYVQLDPDTRMLVLAPLSFDASTLEIWGPLLNGGVCVLYPQDRPVSAAGISQVLSSQSVTHAWLTSSLFNTIIDEDPAGLSALRFLLTGGEALSPPHVRKALAMLPATQLINGYGPTENTTFTTCFSIPQDFDPAEGGIPIGLPINGTEVRVVDEQLQPVAPGTEGELIALGDGLAHGYLGDPEQTAQRFIDWAAAGDRAGRAYRTGDRVRQRPDGIVEFLGRFDDQVKIEGHRIEPAEIESVIDGLNKVRQCRVIPRKNAHGHLRLVAYLLTDTPSDVAPLKSALKQLLPSFMLPHFFIAMERFPMTANGKLDVRALPDPTASAGADATRPTAGKAAVIRRCWERILGMLPDQNTSFFDAGGTSLDAVKLHTLLASELPDALPPTFVFQFPTIAAQTAELAEAGQAVDAPVDRGQKRRVAMRARRGR